MQELVGEMQSLDACLEAHGSNSPASRERRFAFHGDLASEAASDQDS